MRHVLTDADRKKGQKANRDKAIARRKSTPGVYCPTCRGRIFRRRVKVKPKHWCLMCGRPFKECRKECRHTVGL